MTEEKSEEDQASLKDTPYSLEQEETASPIAGREREAHKRIQHENSDHVARLFDILERARHNLRDLEKRRTFQTEGLRNLRAQLFRENELLRLTATGVPSSSLPAGPSTSKAVAPTATTSRLVGVSSPPATWDSQPETAMASTSASVSPSPHKKTSSKSVTIAQPPSQSLGLDISEGPRTSSSRSLQKRGSSRINRISKHRMLPINADNMSGISEESEQSATVRNLKQRFLSNFKY